MAADLAGPADATSEQTDMSLEAQEFGLMVGEKEKVIKDLRARLSTVTVERDEVIIANQKLSRCATESIRWKAKSVMWLKQHEMLQ